MSLSSHQSARMKNDEWLTPPEWLRALGEFDLDPCAPVTRPWDTARKHFTIADDGLAQAWHGRVWLNPPFGRDAAKWLKRIAEHNNGVALIPARTETAMFYESVWPRADAVCFVRGRPHFHYVDGRRAPFNSGAPICLVAYGRANTIALLDSRLGHVVET
ncbi:DNA N-6-adenine-methyltransferase [Burkholderia cenocepacia]|uniref:DNA N-6-adenine-methyltransferase n=1 Tax=Burkholderia cenocepacia TaxID=95486 RepID=UPI00264DD9D1|nr:DNA N-6-adenine-methyltransferase [Burkholderia cenocepacia]MDN7458150.1 DNA N-6-adenine-methyltransferase [Burkholderia cenocepacia]